MEATVVGPSRMGNPTRKEAAMAQRIEDVMTPNPATLPSSANLVAASRAMRDYDVGSVVVLEDGKPCGIVTDRDIVVRGLAAGKNPDTPLADICSRELITVSRDDGVDDAIRLMREKALRRLPVVDRETVVGVVSIGDLAVRRDPESALADISSARPNR